MRFLWFAITTFSVCIGTYYSVVALSNSDVAHTLETEEYREVFGTLELPYPAVTACPVQFNDRWNLQRELLNEIDMFDEQRLLRREELRNFNSILDNVLSKKWAHGNAIESLSKSEREIAQRVMALTVMNDADGDWFRGYLATSSDQLYIVQRRMGMEGVFHPPSAISNLDPLPS